MTNVTIRQLRYFEALAREAHFGRAAEACSVTQPALSVQIKELEQELGVTLFERGARQVRLTGFGEEFSGRVQDILRGVDELGDLARAARKSMIGRLRLGVIPTIAPYLLPRIIARLRHENDDLDVHVRETLTPRLVQELTDGRLDAAIVALPISDPAFNEVELFTENMMLVRASTYAGQPVPEKDALRDMRLLLLEEGHCFRDQALSFCNIPSSLPQDGLDGSSLSTLVQMVGAGLGVTLIPEMAVPVETRSAAVCVDAFRAPQPTRTVGMIWRRTSPLERHLREVAEVVRAAADEMRAEVKK